MFISIASTTQRMTTSVTTPSPSGESDWQGLYNFTVIYLTVICP